MPCDTTANKISVSAVKQPEVKWGYQSLLNNQEVYHQAYLSCVAQLFPEL